MELQKIWFAGEWVPSKEPVETFWAFNPKAGVAIEEHYPVSGSRELEGIVSAACSAQAALQQCTPEQRATFLEAFALEIEKRAEAIVKRAALETGLPESPRLNKVELPRATLQLRLAAAAARERTWCNAVIDTQNNLRSKFGALSGPVAVFGPNNFPIAFNGIAGGDFASAIAAGNAVIAKAHPNHPGTTRILAEAAQQAVTDTELPKGTVQMLYHMPPELGLKLVSDSRLGAVGFTGSRRAGLRLKQASDEAGVPIYLELGSVNPILILEGALEERLDSIADELAGSCVLGAGQFCTNPGLSIVLKSEWSQRLLNQLKQRLLAAPSGILLSKRGVTNVKDSVDSLVDAGAELLLGGEPIDGPSYGYANTLLRVSGKDFLESPQALQAEAFGAVHLMVEADSVEQMDRIASQLEGSLTATFYTHTQGKDDAEYARLEPLVRAKVGRLLNDKMPTGVAVSPAMVHGGPYPASGHPGFTSVGIPASITRFAALQCYDNVRPHRLPPELQDENPTGTMWRNIDGMWTQASVGGDASA